MWYGHWDVAHFCFLTVCIYCMCVSVCVYVYGTVETKAQAASADTFKHRLEQLDDIEEVCACMCVCVCVCVCVCAQDT